VWHARPEDPDRQHGIVHLPNLPDVTRCLVSQKGLRPVLQQIVLDRSQPFPSWHSPDACVKGQTERITFVDGRCMFLFMDDLLFIPQCIDGFHPGCCASRVDSEEYSDSDGKTDSKKDR